MLKTSLSAVNRIGQKFFIKTTLNRKISSGHIRTSTIKHDYMPMTVFKGIRNDC